MAIPSNLKQNKKTGEAYWDLKYEIGIMFGEISMKAKVFWDVEVSAIMSHFFPRGLLLMSSSYCKTGDCERVTCRHSVELDLR